MANECFLLNEFEWEANSGFRFRAFNLDSSCDSRPVDRDPSPIGSTPISAPTTHETLISKYGDNARAAPYAALRPTRSQRSTRTPLPSAGIPASGLTRPATSPAGRIRLPHPGEATGGN